MAKQAIIYVKCYTDWFNLSDCIFLFFVFAYFRLLNFSLFFIYVVLPHNVGEIKLYIKVTNGFWLITVVAEAITMLPNLM